MEGIFVFVMDDLHLQILKNVRFIFRLAFLSHECMNKLYSKSVQRSIREISVLIDLLIMNEWVLNKIRAPQRRIRKIHVLMDLPLMHKSLRQHYNVDIRLIFSYSWIHGISLSFLLQKSHKNFYKKWLLKNVSFEFE